LLAMRLSSRLAQMMPYVVPAVIFLTGTIL